MNDTDKLNILHEHALILSKQEFDRNWLFVYEVLTEMELNDDWKFIKRNHISFIKSEFQYY